MVGGVFAALQLGDNADAFVGKCEQSWPAVVARRVMKSSNINALNM